MDKGKICKIRNIARAIAELDTRLMNQFGICINEAMLLCILSEHELMTASAIAEELGVTPSNASKIIRIVEEKEYIERSIDKRDHRKMFFSLSTEGQQKIETMKASSIEFPAILQEII